MSKLNELSDKLKETRKQVEIESKVAVLEAIKEYFEREPKAHAVMWSQFTPYWCDGSPCTFSLHEVWNYVPAEPFRAMTVEELVSMPNIEWDPQDAFNLELDESGLPEDIQKLLENGDDSLDTIGAEQFGGEVDEKLYNILQKHEEILEMAFGDHVFVVVSRDGTIATKKVEHD